MYFKRYTWAKVSLVVLLALVLGACKAGFGRSGDNDLQTLTVSGGNLMPSFSRDQLEYTMLVGATTDSVDVLAVIEDEAATMTVNGQSTASGATVAVPLQSGRNEINIVVTAENELRKTYEIVITRSDQTSNDASLNSLTLKDAQLDSAFVDDQLEYSSQVNFFVNQTAVSVQRGSQFAKVRVADQTTMIGDNQMSEPVMLQADTVSEIDVSVESEDSSNTNTYKVQVARSARADLGHGAFVKARAANTGDSFASALAASAEVLVIGAPEEDSGAVNNEEDNSLDSAGAVYVFQNNGGTWTQARYLKAVDAPAAGDRFGSSVATSSDWIAVGAPGRNSEAGSAHLYSRASGSWEAFASFVPQEITGGDKFGEAMTMVSWLEDGAVETQFLFVSAPGRSSGQGAVYVYRREENNWNLTTTLLAQDAAGGDGFGSALAVNTRSQELEIAVGAPGKNNGTGAAYVFRKSGDASTSTWLEIAKVESFNPESGDRFGSAVAFAGNVLAVGAPLEDSSSAIRAVNFNDGDVLPDNGDATDSGAVYLFNRESLTAVFVNQAYLKGNGGAGSEFGGTLAYSAAMLAVGAPKNDSGERDIDVDSNAAFVADAGAVHVFSFDGALWSEDPIFVKPQDTGVADEFGRGIAFNGVNLFVAAPGEDSAGGGVDVGYNDNAEASGAVFIIR